MKGRSMKARITERRSPNHWSDEELELLRASYESVTGRSWVGDVLLAGSNRGSVRTLKLRASQWAKIAKMVGTRTLLQCRDRMRTDIEQAVKDSVKKVAAPAEPSAQRAVNVVTRVPKLKPRFIPDCTPWYSDKPFAGMSDADIAAWARS